MTSQHIGYWTVINTVPSYLRESPGGTHCDMLLSCSKSLVACLPQWNGVSYTMFKRQCEFKSPDRKMTHNFLILQFTKYNTLEKKDMAWKQAASLRVNPEYLTLHSFKNHKQRKTTLRCTRNAISIHLVHTICVRKQKCYGIVDQSLNLSISFYLKDFYSINIIEMYKCDATLRISLKCLKLRFWYHKKHLLMKRLFNF